jgi:hypothetical protein
LARRNTKTDAERRAAENKRRATPNSPRIAMLNIHRLGSFKYDLREALAASPLDKSVAPTIVANIIAKASRVSVKETKEYIKDLEAQGIIDQIAAEDACAILDRYSKYR